MRKGLYFIDGLVGRFFRPHLLGGELDRVHFVDGENCINARVRIPRDHGLYVCVESDSGECTLREIDAVDVFPTLEKYVQKRFHAVQEFRSLKTRAK